MRYIDSFREGMHISDVYLCKNRQIALTKNGKEYGNLVLQDKTGTIDGLYSYDNVFVNNTKEYQMRIIDGKNQLTLLLLEYDEDGCATFQLGDSIIEIETAYDERFYALMNSYITLFVEKINVYDENL